MGVNVVRAFAANELKMNPQAAPAPSFVAVALLTRLGCSSLVSRVVPELVPTAEHLHSALAAFEAWFRTPVAVKRSGLPIRLKRGSHRVKQSSGANAPAPPGGAADLVSVLSLGWPVCRRNQESDVITNGLIAAFSLKQTLVDEFGPGACSLGTVTVESDWFADALGNLNPCGVFSTNAARQYRAMTSWKERVRSKIANLSPMQRSHLNLNDHAHMLETAAAYNGCPGRLPLVCASGQPDTVPLNQLNGFFDDFRRSITT